MFASLVLFRSSTLCTRPVFGLIGLLVVGMASGGATPASLHGPVGTTHSLAANDPLLTWTRRASGLTPGQLYSVIFAGGRFLVGGQNGAILTSVDGINWNVVTPFSDRFAARAFAYNGIRYVVVGRNYTGAVEFSAWSSTSFGGWVPSSLTAPLDAVAYGAGRFVAVGDGGAIYQSTDGVVWAAVTSPVTTDLMALHYAAGLFVAGGLDGSIITSPDGLTWTNRGTFPGFIEGITYDGTAWIAGNGNVMVTSTDGTTWVRQTKLPPYHITGLNTSSSGTVVAIGTGRIFAREANGDWTDIDIDPVEDPGAQLWGAGEGNGVFVIVGQSRLYTAGALARPMVVINPESGSRLPGRGITLTASAVGASSYAWQRNGIDFASSANTTTTITTIANLQPSTTGLYTATAFNGTASAVTDPAIVGITTTDKIVGEGDEFPNIVHPTGNIFDQILLKSDAAAFTADPGQITRLSYVDMNNDIVQVEFSGPGTVSIALEGSSGPAAPVNYNQSTLYMKGHAGIVVVGATEQTNLSIFSVGRGTALNQSLFNDSITYDGMADVAFVAIQSANGKFGGLRAANATFWSTKGCTGVYAPGVQFTGPVYVHDINAQQDATPVFMIGSALGNTWITGGDLLQANGRVVRVSGLTQLKFADGVTSHYVATAPVASQYLPAKANRGRLERNGVDVTTELVVSP